jgi:hypothetical protein
VHLQFRKITFEEMEALFHGLPLHIILRGVVQGIRRNPISRGATFREESLEAKFEFSLFSEVERIYLGRGAGASISGTMGWMQVGRYLFELTFELEEKGSLVGLKIGAAVVVVAGRDEGGFVYSASNVHRSVGPGHRGRGGGLARADAEGESSCFGGWALGSKGRDDFLEKFVVEIVLGPPGNDFGLELFPKLIKGND